MRSITYEERQNMVRSVKTRMMESYMGILGLIILTITSVMLLNIIAGLLIGTSFLILIAIALSKSEVVSGGLYTD